MVALSPQRGCAETSSRFETVVCVVAPCISTPSTERLRNLASTAHRGSVRHPKANSPCSCAGSIRAARDRSLAAYPLPTFPPPKASKSSTMPTTNCLGLSDLDHAEQAGPQSNHPDQQRSVTAQQSDARRLLP